MLFAHVSVAVYLAVQGNGSCSVCGLSSRPMSVAYCNNKKMGGISFLTAMSRPERYLRFLKNFTI